MALCSPDFINKVMHDNRVWRWVRIDGVNKESVGYSANNKYYVNEYGFVMFRQCTPIMYEIHIAMMKGCSKVPDFVEESIDFIGAMGAKKLIGFIGDWNKPALQLAKKCNFKEEGRVKNAYERDGTSRSMVIVGRTV